MNAYGMRWGTTMARCLLFSVWDVCLWSHGTQLRKVSIYISDTALHDKNERNCLCCRNTCLARRVATPTGYGNVRSNFSLFCRFCKMGGETDEEDDKKVLRLDEKIIFVNVLGPHMSRQWNEVGLVKAEFQVRLHFKWSCLVLKSLIEGPQGFLHAVKRDEKWNLEMLVLGFPNELS